MPFWESNSDSSCRRVRLPNHCCSGTAKSITYSECVFVVLGILYAMRSGLPVSTVFLHIISQTARFERDGERKREGEE